MLPAVAIAKQNRDVKFEVLLVVLLMIYVCWSVMPHHVVNSCLHFKELWNLHLQGQAVL
jgi:hypothetical protein